MTGIGNRLFFDNRLESAIMEASVMSGGVLLIDLACLEELEADQFELLGHDLMMEASATIGAFVRKHNGALQARYAGQVFAVLLPNMSESEMVDSASQLLKSLQRLHWPQEVNPETAVYLGAVCYQAQDSLLKVQEEAELALKSARLQGHNGWFLYEKQLDEEQSSKGTVRWRTLISRRLEEHGIEFYTQPIQQDRGQVVLQQELLTYLHDEQGRALQAGIFMPMAEKVGLLLQLESVGGGAHSRPAAPALRAELPHQPDPQCSEPAQPRVPALALLRPVPAAAQHQRAVDPATLGIPGDSPLRGAQAAASLPADAGLPAGHRSCRSGCGEHPVHQGVRDQLPQAAPQPGAGDPCPSGQPDGGAQSGGGCANTCTRVLAVGVESGDEWKMLRHLGVHAGQGPWFAEPQRLVLEPAGD